MKVLVQMSKVDYIKVINPKDSGYKYFENEVTNKYILLGLIKIGTTIESGWATNKKDFVKNGGYTTEQMLEDYKHIDGKMWESGRLYISMGRNYVSYRADTKEELETLLDELINNKEGVTFQIIK